MTAANVRQARLWAVREAPYFSRALFSLRLVGRPDLPIPIAMAQDATLYFSTTGGSWEDTAVLGYRLLREVHRLVRGHADRRQYRSAERWLLACTLAINDDFPSATPQPPMLNLPYHSYEEVYHDQLPDPAGGGSSPPGSDPEVQEAYSQLEESGSAADGLPREWEDEEQPHLSPTSVRQLQHEVAERTTAFPPNRDRGRGDVPGGLARWASKHNKSKVPWQALLRWHIDSLEPDEDGDFSFSARDRHKPPPLIFPITMSAPSPRIHVVIDTSGSMERSDLDRCITELSTILAVVGTVVYFAGDTRVEHTGRIRQSDLAQLTGGGGTNMDVLIEAAAPGADFIVCLTDGYTPWPEPTQQPLIVATLCQPGPSWAKTIYIKESY